MWATWQSFGSVADTQADGKQDEEKGDAAQVALLPHAVDSLASLVGQ